MKDHIKVVSFLAVLLLLIFSTGALAESACVDTDGGENIFVKGIVKGHWGCPEENNSIVSEIDHCTDSNHVFEYLCNIGCNNILAIERECPAGCSDGACINEDSEPDTCSSTFTLLKGESVTLSTGDQITVTAVDYSSVLGKTKVKFEMAGTITPFLLEGGSYRISDRTKLTVSKILYQAYAGGINSASFCINGVAPTIVEDTTEEEPDDTEPITSSADLENYPQLFIKSGKFNAFIVVGSNAPAMDNLAATDIATTLDNDGIQMYDITKLDSEIVDPLHQNLIVIGKTNTNSIVNRLWQSTPTISVPLKSGEGLIRLFENNGYVQMLVTGYSAEDTRKAARVLMNYDDYDLEGQEVIVVGTLSNPRIKTSDEPVEDEVTEEEEEETDETESQPPQPTPEVEPTPQETCTGCKQNGNCLPYGTRLLKDGAAVYCHIDGTLQQQVALGASCQNNYECASNQCSNAKCIDLSGQLEETNSLLERILNWLKNIF